jgi:hypothetical protein
MLNFVKSHWMVWPDEDYCIRLDINIKTQGPMLNFVKSHWMVWPDEDYCIRLDINIKT